jgi:hypothetical protein
LVNAIKAKLNKNISQRRRAIFPLQSFLAEVLQFFPSIITLHRDGEVALLSLRPQKFAWLLLLIVGT